MADPDVSDGGRLAYMSPQITGILGYRPDELIDDPELWPSRIHPDDRAAAIAAYDAHWRTGEPLRAEYRMLARDGSEVWVRDEAFAMADDTRSGRRVSQGLLVDTTDRKRLESQAHPRRAARPADRPRQPGAAARPPRARPRPAGPRARDASPCCSSTSTTSSGSTTRSATRPATRSCAGSRSAWLARVREGDVVGRQSGDEFAVLLVNVVADDGGAAAAERILGELRRPIQLGGRSIVVGGSIGIAVATAAGTEGRRREGPADPGRRRDVRGQGRSARARSPSSTRGCRSAPGRSSKPRADVADAGRQTGFWVLGGVAPPRPGWRLRQRSARAPARRRRSPP